MRVVFRGRAREMKSVWLSGKSVKFIDQRALPARLKIYTARTCSDVAFAIREMIVRGAPAIGVSAAYGMYFASLQGKLSKGAKLLSSARPTAVDLKNAIDFCLSRGSTPRELKQAALELEEKTISACRKISAFGAPLVPRNARIMTQCNAGALACVDVGTALGVIRAAKAKKPFVFVPETRPRLQGALTAWELGNEGIPYAVISDSARGYFFERGEVDLAIVGADAITMSGDFANKIGTYTLALLAKEHGVPFYVAAPSTSFSKAKGGREIKIEERGEKEVLEIAGKSVFPKGARARNPAFDVTPSRLVTGFICERGVFKPGAFRRMRLHGKI